VFAEVQIIDAAEYCVLKVNAGVPTSVAPDPCATVNVPEFILARSTRWPIEKPVLPVTVNVQAAVLNRSFPGSVEETSRVVVD
jgi:hypothetical protein